MPAKQYLIDCIGGMAREALIHVNVGGLRQALLWRMSKGDALYFAFGIAAGGLLFWAMLGMWRRWTSGAWNRQHGGKPFRPWRHKNACLMNGAAQDAKIRCTWFG
jgi:hypothetical protein